MLIDAVALMPWWACLALALASFLFFRWLSAPPEVAAIHPSRIGMLMVGSVITGVGPGASPA